MATKYTTEAKAVEIKSILEANEEDGWTYAVRDNVGGFFVEVHDEEGHRVGCFPDLLMMSH